ncbi:hypothetical protein LBMAG53_39960 [Planctomycetota bacterium]|nr:hypothetical protein LBMAG53_39960 [Planctomycetota bacterium]
MIPCQVCGNDNPLGTRFCRKCGAKVTTGLADVNASVAKTRRQDRGRMIRGWGSNVLSLGVFILACAVLIRWTATPALPPADLPLPSPGPVIPLPDPVKPAESATPAPPGGAGQPN